MVKEEALKALQVVKCYLQNVASESNQSPTVITHYLSIIDRVQLFIDPKVDLNKLQDSISDNKK